MLFCVTANHRNTPFAVLDRISRDVAGAAGDLRRGSEFVRGAVVLATCNRFEAYLEIEDPLTAAAALATEAVFDTLAPNVSPDDLEALRANATVLTGDDVVRHLFAVSSGLESMVVGEDEIAGQVQRALGAARELGTSSSGLERLFQRATATSRDVRGATGIGEGGRSLARLALDLASARIADWSAAAVLVVGTGTYAATTIAALRDRGAGRIGVFSSTGRAARFAARYGVVAETDLPGAIAAADVVITCTARYTVGVDQVAPGPAPSGAHRLVIDLGLPRNVDAAVGGLPGVELLDLELLALHAPLPELGEGARALVGDAAARFSAEQQAAPAIVALREHVFALLEAEIERVRRRAGDGEVAEQVESSLRHLVGVLLHEPSTRAADLAAAGRLDEFVAGLEAVLGVDAEAAIAAARSERPA